MSDLPSYFELQQMDEIEKLRREVKLMGQLMNEMAEALDEIRFHEQKYVENSPEETTYYLRVTNKVLEKYRKFLEGIK